MVARGVRRVFGVFLKERTIKEWCGVWQALPERGEIADRCLARPVPVRAILNAAEADDAVARALVDKGNRVIRGVVAQSRSEGIKEGRDEGIKEGRDEGIKEGRDEGIK